MAAWIIGLALLSSDTSSVSVELRGPQALVAEVEAGLRREGAPVDLRRVPAELAYELRIVGDQVRLRSRDDDEERVVGFTRAPEAAARRVVVIVVDAVRRYQAQAQTPELVAEFPERPESDTRLSLEVGSLGWWWQSPGQAQLGLEAAVAWRVGPLRLGARGGQSGWCCSWTQDGVSAEVVQTWVGAEAEVELLRLGSWALGLSGSLGLAHEATLGRATVFAGPGLDQRTERWGMLGRAGAMAGLRPDRHFELVLRGGLWVADQDLRIQLPQALAEDRRPSARGSVGPWLTLGARFHLFSDRSEP